MSYATHKPERTPPRAILPAALPLSPAGRARAAGMRDKWRAAFGDDQFIRDLVDAGLIHGWRDVLSVTTTEDPDHGHD